MGIIESAVTRALDIAADDSHGYDQANRWGPDYDCSSLVISVYRKAGVPLSCTYTGNMRGDMLRCGFEDVTGSVDLGTGEGLERGDVLLNHVHHTALYIGGGQIVQASINEYGTTAGGQTGDQTGREIYTRGYYNYPWDCVLRYEGRGGEPQETPESGTPKNHTRHGTCQILAPILARGDTGPAVAAAQAALHISRQALGAGGIDGDFGPATEAAVKNYQTANGLHADGIIGNNTWSKLLN